MSGKSESAGEQGPAHRTLEIAVALVIVLFGLTAILGSIRVGIDWGAEGPKAGFFPFYVGVMIVGAGAINLYQAIAVHSKGGLFASWRQLRQVLSVVIPTAIYVAVIPFIGIYLSSAVLIGVFMRWLGKYRWPVVLGIAIGVPLLIFVVFERWFLVPLPKGPIEEWLGF